MATTLEADQVARGVVQAVMRSDPGARPAPSWATTTGIPSLYQEDLAYVHARAFGDLAAGAAMSIVNRLRHAPAAVRRVIDVGCGAGATTRALSDAGFDAIGIEPSLALLEMARVAAPRAEFRHASVYEVDLPPCEAVLAVGEPLTYHPPSVDADAALQRLIRTVADVLPLGGVFVFDVIVAAGPPLDARGWRSGDDWAILYEVTEDRPTRRMTRSIETFRKSGPLYRRAHEVHHVRLFEEQALRSWLIRAGFEVETAHSYGDQPLPPQRVAFFATRCECRDSIETR